MQTIARMITRPSREGSDQPDMGLIAFYKNNNVLKADRVYEIREVLGVLTIVDVGASPLSGKTPEARFHLEGWVHGPDAMLTCNGARGYFTAAELDEERALLDAEYP